MIEQSMNIEDFCYDQIKEYTKYVSESRVLPHLDLKPVHRRILWTCLLEKARGANKGLFRKSSTIEGVVQRFHPHAGSYPSIVTLVNTPNALLQGRGNFGNRYGDKSAHQRYTETKTSDLFEEIYDEYTEIVGDLIPNYDNTTKEPVMLQSKVPIAPLIGISGIGIGFATNLPAYHISSVKKNILNVLDNKEPIYEDYAYGGVLYNNKIYPIFEKIDGGIRITEIPLTSTIKFNNLKNIQNLVSSEKIEIIDNSFLNKIDISIKAPTDIIEQIINSLIVIPKKNFSYFYKKLRISGYYTEWVKERISFIRKREYYKKLQDWNNFIIKTVLTEINISNKKISDVIDDIVKNIYNLYSKNIEILEDMKSFIPTEESIKSKIKSSPISKIKDYGLLEIPFVKVLSDEEIKNIIKEEINSINENLFSKKTKSIKSLDIPYIENNIHRYVVRCDGFLDIRFKPVPRYSNTLINSNENLYAVYQDLSTEKIDNFYTGIFKSKDDNKKLVGYKISDKLSVIVTVNNNIYIYKTLSKVPEVISNIFVCDKIQVDDKIYNVESGQIFKNIKNWKIIE